MGKSCEQGYLRALCGVMLENSNGIQLPLSTMPESAIGKHKMMRSPSDTKREMICAHVRSEPRARVTTEREYGCVRASSAVIWPESMSLNVAVVVRT